jgi:hypothetical protein
MESRTIDPTLTDTKLHVYRSMMQRGQIRRVQVALKLMYTSAHYSGEHSVSRSSRFTPDIYCTGN